MNELLDKIARLLKGTGRPRRRQIVITRETDGTFKVEADVWDGRSREWLYEKEGQWRATLTEALADVGIKE